MSMHEKAPEEFVNTFNKAWDIGLQAAILLMVFLFCYFFFGVGGWGPFVVSIIACVVLYGLFRLFMALFVGPADPDAEDTGH